MLEMFKDFFSQQASHYARYRPKYPAELFTFIKEIVQKTNFVWDVATGNGQAANELAKFFDHVYATDLSDEQLKYAIQQENIEYKKEFAESTSLANSSVDLITIATAIHWFDQPAFFKEADRVLKTKGVLFAWSYGGCKVNIEVDQIIDYFNFEYLVDYWHEGAKMNWYDKYQSLILPFEPISTPNFICKANYNLEEVMNYMFSWSGVQNYIRLHQKNPIEIIQADLEKAWGDPLSVKEIKWHLHTKCSRK